jgi:hypothetical protein
MGYFLSDAGKHLSSIRTPRDQGRDTAQRRLLIYEPTKVALCSLGLREVAECAADEHRFALDHAQGELDRELNAVRTHSSQLQPAAEEPPFAGLDETGEGTPMLLP